MTSGNASECARHAPMLGSREEELTAEERAALAAHLRDCAACRAWQADLAATEGLLAEGLSRAAARRDFTDFADQVMARVERASAPRGLRPFLRRHRMAVRFAAALAPALATVALIVYLDRSPAPPDVDVTSEEYVPIVISTNDGPMVLLGDESEGL